MPNRIIPLFALSMIVALGTLSNASVREPQPVKDFTLEAINAEGEFTLSNDENQYVALHFLLKTDCPICLMYTQEYFSKADEFPNVTHVFIKPDDPDEIAEWAAKLEKDEDDKQPVIYRDPDAKLAKQLKVPHGYRFRGEVVHYPALIVLNAEKKEIFRYVGEDTRDRFTFDKFEEMMGMMEAL